MDACAPLRRFASTLMVRRRAAPSRTMWRLILRDARLRRAPQDEADLMLRAAGKRYFIFFARNS